MENSGFERCNLTQARQNTGWTGLESAFRSRARLDLIESDRCDKLYYLKHNLFDHAAANYTNNVGG